MVANVGSHLLFLVGLRDGELCFVPTLVRAALILLFLVQLFADLAGHPSSPVERGGTAIVAQLAIRANSVLQSAPMKELRAIDCQFISREEFEAMDADFRALQESSSKVRRIKRKRNRDQYEDAIGEAFDLIGGVPRLAHWAHQNPGEYFTKLYPKLLPDKKEVEHSGAIKLIHVLPPTKLDE